MSKLPARTGWQWFKTGFGLFRIQPGLLTLLLFSNLLGSLLLTIVPYVGTLVAMVLIPSLSMAPLQACTEIDHGKRANLSVLLTGFRSPSFKMLCKLGLVYLVISIVLTLLMRVAIDPAALRPVPVAGGGAPVLTLSGADGLALFGIFSLQCVSLILLSFAAPLTHWQNMPPFKATFYSVFAVLGAKGAFAVLVLVWFGLMFASSIVAFAIFGNGKVGLVLISWIVLLFALLLQCALYAAFRQIFGAPDVLGAKRA